MDFNVDPTLSDVEFWRHQATLPGVASVVQDDENMTGTKAIQVYIMDMLDLEGKKVLDLGCGIGRLFPCFINGGASEIHAIDFCKEMILIASLKYSLSNNPVLVFYEKDFAEGLAQVPSDLIDISFSVNSLCYIRDPNKFSIVFSSLVSKTKEILFLLEPFSISKYVYYPHSRITTYPKQIILDVASRENLEILVDQRMCFGDSIFPDSWRQLIILKRK